MTSLPQSQLRLADLPTKRPTEFELTPNATERAALAKVLGIDGIKKLRFRGELHPIGKSDWQLGAEIGATVVQPCVVTLDPVTTRIDEKISRRYMADLPDVEASEVEMPEDDSVEALPETLDLIAVMTEALALALPVYPRSEGAELGQAAFTEPGTTAMTDEDAKPFAGLAVLRESFENKGE